MLQGYRPRWLATRTCALAVVVFTTPALADPWALEGRVVAVSDGDTITLLDSENKQHKVRINGIDAEKGQAFGERSRQNLAQIAHGKDARSNATRSLGWRGGSGATPTSSRLRTADATRARRKRSPPAEARVMGGRCSRAAVGVAQG